MTGLQFEKKSAEPKPKRQRTSKKDIDENITAYVLKQAYIYHLCPNNVLYKIVDNPQKGTKGIGLCPKMGSWKSFREISKKEREELLKPVNAHKEFGRIYFFFEDNTNESYFKQKVLNGKNNGYTLLRVDTSKLLPNTSFYKGPRQDGAVFTMCNIPKEAIEIVI